MESLILKIICANQGSVSRTDLICNLCPGDPAKVSELIGSGDKLVLCTVNREERVVARSRLFLCRAKDCPGGCRGLHLCKSFLLGESCRFSRQRRQCNFSHDLDSDHNQRMLGEHGLQNLIRAELCTLQLQSDNTLLPQVCHDYNNGSGEFGLCQDGDDCKRLHICERSFTHDCSDCPKSHDFADQQPLKVLRERGIPDALHRSLKYAYANKAALWSADKLAGRVGQKFKQSGDGDRGRGRGGFRGNRGNRGGRGGRGGQGRLPLSRATSLSDILAGTDFFSLSDGLNDADSGGARWGSPIDNSDTRSDSGHTYRERRNSGGRGRGGNRGNFRPPPRSELSGALSEDAQDRGAAGDGGANRRPRQRPARDKTEICMYFIKGHCKHEDRCFKAHDKMPYRWQVNEGDKWTALPDNETIEKDYCDPHNSYSTSNPPVHFDTMTRGDKKVRRLSTINSLTEPMFIHTTEWLWYWQDEFGKWNLYAADGAGHQRADISSAKLEQKFLDNDKDVVEFTAGSQTYSLSFQDMMQRNKRYGTSKVVCRRPRFVSAEEVKTKKVRRPPLNPTAVPDHWDRAQVPETGFTRVPLQKASEEFSEVKALFSKTMSGFKVDIDRIQNKALWEVYQLKKSQMKKSNGGRDVAEMKLFHGTDSKHLDAICLSNFDWRICGTHGTAYGRGSYFARDASYSHSYAGNSDTRSMFVSRVLVGNYTKGSPSYLRPPPKDGDINFYNSCVNDLLNPSIFVVFETPQIYPEYLLQYKKVDWLDDLLRDVSVPAPRPRPAVAPRTGVTQTSGLDLTSTQRRSTSMQPSSSSYSLGTTSPSPQRALSSYHRTTPSYTSSSSAFSSSSSSSSSVSYSPTTPSYRSSTSSSQYNPSTTPTLRAEKSKDSCVIA